MDKNELEKKVSEINEIITGNLPEAQSGSEYITEAVRYSVLAGGKRLRPMIMQEFYKLFAPDGASVILPYFMCAIEYIHTYSLVHDDLPAMDNDELRRGKPSTHAAYGEAFGILAGDALLNYAFEVVLDKLTDIDDAKELKRAVKALDVLASKAGIYGMVGGQALDVYSEKTEGFENTAREIDYIYKNKTGALIEASGMVGAILAGASDAQISDVEKILAKVGLAFQIRDDIIDLTSTSEVLGKPAKSDEKNEKITYVILNGLYESQQEVEKLSNEAVSLLGHLGGNNEFLTELILYLTGREN